MDEIWRKTIDLWREGGQRGVNQAVAYLQAIGLAEGRKEAREMVLAAIKIYRGE